MKYLIAFALLLFACGQNEPTGIKTIPGTASRLAPNPQPNNHSPSTLRGDADGDGTVSFSIDGPLLFNFTYYGTGTVIEANLDINCDGVADTDDFGSWIEDILGNNGGKFCPAGTGLDCLPAPVWFHKPLKRSIEDTGKI